MVAVSQLSPSCAFLCICLHTYIFVKYLKVEKNVPLALFVVSFFFFVASSAQSPFESLTHFLEHSDSASELCRHSIFEAVLCCF